MAHHKFNHGKVNKILLSDYKVDDFEDDDYFSSYQHIKHKVVKKHYLSKLPRLRPH